MSTLILTVPGESTDTDQPIAYADAIINVGTKWMLDFCNPACNPNLAGVLASGATFKNLVTGGTDGNIIGSGGDATITNTLDEDGKPIGIVLAATSGSRQISLGTGYDLHSSNHSFLVCGWAKSNGVGNNNGIAGLGTGTTKTTHQFTIEGTLAGASIFGDAGGSSVTVTMPTGVAQFAVAWDGVNGLMQMFINGALAGQTGAGQTLYDASAYNTLIGSGAGGIMWKGTIYRVFQEDLTLSGMSASAVVANDYAMNLGRFS